MELTIQGRNLELDGDTRDYISKKVNRVGRHISSTRSAAVQICQEKTRRVDQRFSAQITGDVNGSVIRSEERASSPRAAIDAAAHAIDHRVQRLKGRMYRGERAKHSGASIRFDQPEEAQPSEEDGRVVRVKRYPIKPMTVEEAIFQIDMLGHDFFLFLSSDDQQYNLLYKRTDGDYGLIIPDML